MIDLSNHEKIDLFCIGTPKVFGDAIGPIVGSMLQQHSFEKDIRIIGTLADPVTVSNYDYKLALLRPDAFILVVDATLGDNVGTFDIVMEPTNPGASLMSGIQPVGDASVRAYTGSTVEQIIYADNWDVVLLGYKITTRLLDLLSYNKKGIYIEVV